MDKDLGCVGKRKAKFLVGITEPGYADHSVEAEMLSPLGAEVRIIRWGGDRTRLLEQLKGLDIVMLRDIPVLDAEAIGLLNENGGIVRYGVGVDTVDLEAARRRGIKVANTPDYGAEIEVADHATALTLALVRRVVARDAQVKSGQWNIAQKEPIYRIAGSTLGLFGFGKIARAYLERMRGFGIDEVLVYDPFIADEFAVQFKVKRASFDDICRHAQIISLHAPATPETRHIVNASTLALMNERTCLINTARGALVDIHALAETLKAGKIFGAALDVLDREPIDAACPLRKLNNVILTDHTAWYSESSVRTIQKKAAQAAYEMLTTGTPASWVNKW
ncbi:MAG: D-3-phosphoglycerate dehydrogenase (Phosphoglycerate dehydrogenase)-like protein [Proteobacteria bacterium]|nr:D-3-phosphoglycerate dehydrogenase (Phosphoglycerate dehydrogenase)-like protein [Pseudomonadota bacterium]